MNHQSVGYIRVSSISQNLLRQLEGIELDRTFQDVVSGSVKERTGLNACIEYLRDGDTLFVDSIDRLARNLSHLQEIIKTLIEKGVSIRFLKENLTFTANQDPMATLMLQMMGAFAEFERSMIRSRQKEGIALAIKSGKRMGRPPSLTKEHKTKAKEMKEKGVSIRKIAMTMKISRASVYKLLDLAPNQSNKEV